MKTFVNIYKWLVVSIFAVFSVAISSNAQQGCTASPTGLVSWWRAEGNGLDSVGGNTAFAPLISGDVTFGPGKVGQAFQLNSPDANLVVPASSTLNVAAGGSFTAEAWINLSNVDGYHPIIEWHDNGRNPGAHLWIIPSGALYSDIKDTNGNAHPFNSANNVVAANVFQHVALTYDHSTGTGTIYLNGAVVAQANLGSFVPQTSFNLWFGHRPGDVPGDITYGSYLGGRLDEVSIYNRALGSNEIAAIYSAGAAGKCDGVSSGVAPSITHQPTNQTVAAGANVSFSATATGSPTLHYQWYGPSETLIPGANSSTLILSNVQPAAAGAYFLLVTNQFGFAVSSNAVLTVTGGGTGGGSNSCTPPPSGLVAWWKGENNTLDSVGANNGIVIDGPIAYAPGEVGSAFHYDDAGGYVSVPAAPSLDVGQGGGLTLEAWIQPADLQNQMPLFEWQFNTNTDANGIHFWISAINGPGCLFANIVDSNFNSHWIYSAPGLVTGDYQHVALTYDKSSGVASIYRNGVLVVSQNLGSFTPNTTGNLLLGERTYLNNDPQFHYVGGLDEMSVYSRALSQSEIAAIFNAGSAGKCGGSNGPAAAGLIVPNYSVSNQVYNPAGTMNQPLRMQMVYGASQFPSHPIVITELRWRPDVNAGGPLSVIVSNLQVKLSTTAAGPDQLSTIFTQNTGSDETVVYSGAAAISTAFTTLSNGTKAFDISLHLQTPFTYDPSKGNLLVDLRDLYGCIPARTVQFNIVNSTGVYGDAVSRVFSIDPNATNAETADTGADVLDIVYTAATNSGTAPVITQQPTNRTVNAGGIATFSVTATGSPTLHYQWYGPAGALISGATTSTLTLSNVQPASAGAYFVFVTNSFGFAQSSNAVLTVTGGDGGGGTNSCTPAPSGIVSWWPGEGNGNDIVGSNNAVLESGVTFAPGKVGQAFQLLNYSNGWAHVPASASLNVGSGNGFTMEGWINVASVSGLHPIAEWHGNTRTSTGVTLWLNSSQSQSGSLFASVIETNETEHSLASPTGAVQPNVFQHVALTYDKASGSATLYLNGAAVAYSSIGSIVPQTISDLYFGHRPLDVPGDASYGAILGGSLDEFAIYNRALGSNEIAAIYNAGANGKCSPTNSNTGTAPLITHQPTNQTVVAGANVTFTAAATGSPTLHYQWYGPASALIPGATSSTLTLSNVQPASAGAYYVFVTNSFGFAQSSNAVLTVIGGAPVITQQPTNQTVPVGGIATFSVTASGPPTVVPHFQWYGPNSALIPGATTSLLSLSNVQPSAAGAYFVVITNVFGFATSSNAILTVTGGGSGSNSCTPVPSGIVSWWKAEGNALDSVDGNNGTLINGLGFGPGEVGQAFLFTHTNQNVLIPASSNLDVGLGDGLTVEAWIKPSTITNYDPIFEWNADDGITYWGPHLYVLPTGNGNGQLYADVQGVGDNWHQMWSAPGLVVPNTFQHVALTYDKASGVARLYLNGAIVVETAFGTFTPKTTGNLNIGDRPTDPAGQQFTFTGLIDEPSVYRRALGSNEIAAIFNAGANGKCDVTNSNTGTAPVITQQPTNRTVNAGGIATFSVTATGTPTLHYQWYGPAGALISGATTSTLTLSNVQPASAGAYYVFVTNSFGFAQSSNAVLTVIGEAPVITRQPTNQTVPVGGTATFSVIVSVPPTVVPHFQWYGPNGAPIPGAATSTLFMFNVQPSAAGAYFVIVTNQFGSVTSSNAVLTVTNPAVSSCVPAPTNVAAWWPAEGTGVDIVGGATATLNGGATFAPGEVGQAFLLNGTNDYLTATSSNLNIAANGSFTVEAWIKVSDVADYHPIVEWNDNAGHAGVHFWILPYSGETPGVLFANLVDTNGHSHSFHTPGGSVSTNGFQHVALTYDQPSGIATIYVNSNIVAQLPLGSFAPQTSFPLWMGHRPNDVPGDATYGAHLGGLLDELTLYRRALSQSEIGAIYNAGANGKCPPSVIVHAAINPQPTVTLSASGGSYTLSWPVSAANYTLQSTADLTPPINWTNVPGTLQTNGGLIQITLPEGGPQGYFRLYQP